MKNKQIKLNKIERAILLLAEYLENPQHDQFKVRQHILEMLGLEEVKK